MKKLFLKLLSLHCLLLVTASYPFKFKMHCESSPFGMHNYAFSCDKGRIDFAIYRQQKRAKIESIYVHPKQRGRGIGTKLLKLALSFLRDKKNLQSVELYAYPIEAYKKTRFAKGDKDCMEMHQCELEKLVNWYKKYDFVELMRERSATGIDMILDLTKKSNNETDSKQPLKKKCKKDHGT